MNCSCVLLVNWFRRQESNLLGIEPINMSCIYCGGAIVKTCLRCGAEHAKPGTYCSRSCANKRNHSPEVYRKMALALALSRKNNPLSDAQRAHISTMAKKAAEKKRQQQMLLPFDMRAKYIIKEIIFAEQDKKCLHCNLSVWLEKPIMLELDHIDGNNKNNVRSNLRLLCPNCHSQTPTWRKAKSHPMWKRGSRRGS